MSRSDAYLPPQPISLAPSAAVAHEWLAPPTRTRHRRGDTLTQRDAEIVLAYAGGCTLQEIGDAVGLTRERVRQILRGAGYEGSGSPFQCRARLRNTNGDVVRQRSKVLAPGDWEIATTARNTRTRASQTATLCTLTLALGRAPTLGEAAEAIYGNPRFHGAILSTWGYRTGRWAHKRTASPAEASAAFYASAGLVPRPSGHHGHIGGRGAA